MKNLYFHRRGGLLFWRAGRLGGSFYLARPRAKSARSAGTARSHIWRIRSTAYGPQLARVRSVADLGGAVLAVLYSGSAALGAAIAAVAMWH